MRYLVTGGAGFIGSNLVEKLLPNGEVTVIDNLSTGRLQYLEPFLSSITFVQMGVTEWSKFAPYAMMLAKHAKEGDIAEFQFDVIFHLAALARIQPSFDRPLTTHEANSDGTINMLEWVRRYNSNARFVYAGSSSFYHDVYANPYAYTKWLGEQHCALYTSVYGLKTAIARFFNVYGPNQPTEGPYATVIGIFERQQKEGVPLTVTGTGEQRRDFTHVSDIVDGLIKISEAEKLWQPLDEGGLAFGQPPIFNLGTGTNHSILEVAEMFNHPIEFIPARPGEAYQTLADIRGSHDILGYEPKERLEDYISRRAINR